MTLGTVDERYVLGRAVCVLLPFQNFGIIPEGEQTRYTAKRGPRIQEIRGPRFNSGQAETLQLLIEGGAGDAQHPGGQRPVAPGIGQGLLQGGALLVGQGGGRRGGGAGTATPSPPGGR